MFILKLGGDFMDINATNQELIDRIKQLEKENLLYKNVIDSLPINLFAKDTECRYIITNKMCDYILGVDHKDIIGKTDFDIRSSKELAEYYYNEDINIMKNKVGTREIAPTVYHDTIKYFDVMREPILDNEGNVLGLIGIVIDSDETISSYIKNLKETNKQINIEYNNHLVFEYNFVTKEAIIEIKPDIFDFLPTKIADFDEFIIHNNIIDTKNLIKSKKVFDDILNGKTESSGVIELIIEGVNRPMLLTVNSFLNKDGIPSRAICILRILDDSNAEIEHNRIILNDASSNFNSMLMQSFESIIYVSPQNNWYCFLKTNNTNISKEVGTFEEIKTYWENIIIPQDWQQLIELYNNSDIVKHGRRPGINSVRARFVYDGITVWKAINIFSQPTEDDDNAFIVAIENIDDDVREENRIKRHDSNRHIIDVLSTIVKYRDLESGEHIRRIELLSEILLKEYSKLYENNAFTEEQIRIISAASAMHDIGKLAISDTILLKPGKLTKEEYDAMKEHTTKGSELVETISSIQDNEYAKYCYEICRYHHERYDGQGYPEGLVGDNIPLAAQIVSIADVYDALVSKRCYKDAYQKNIAYNMIKNGECGVFSDEIIQCFDNCIEQIEALYT